MAASTTARRERGPLVAGVELAAGAVRAVVARREDGRLRVIGVGTTVLPAAALSGGLVVDRGTVTAALGSALLAAEGRERAPRVIVALDGDDLRTYHTGTAFERRDEHLPIAVGELSRATREAHDEGAKAARAASSDDPALRGIVTAQLDAQVAGFVLDGRPLDELQGFHGRSVVVYTDVVYAPLMHTGAISAVLEAARRRGTTTSGAYALGRLLAASGFTDGGVLRVGADVTAYAVVREGRVVATRAFALGRDGLLARGGTIDGDAAVWARCVTARHEGIEGTLPSRWYFVGVPESLVALPRALGEALAAERGGNVNIAPLKIASAGRIVTDLPLHADHLVAAGAAALGAELY